MTASATILVFDDDRLIRKLLQTMLESLGYRVLEAVDGLGGLRLCSEDPPDLVLLDIRMPGLDGVQICHRLKAETATKDIPVIFLSSSHDSEEKLRAFHAGGVDYITKPFQVDEFRVRIETHLELQKQRRELASSHELLEKALFDAGMMNGKLIAVNEKLRQSEEIKSQFIANMRNEINNPLGAILGLSEQITHPTLPPERGRLLARMIHGEASSLDFQIRNIFCAAELESGEACPVVTQVEVGSVLREVVDSLAYLAQSKSVKIVLSELRDGDALCFTTDADKLRAIAANLIANAVEFSHPDGVVDVRTAVQDDALMLAVKDRGIGIPEADRRVIFDRFRQLDSGATRRHPGQGLGLSIVKALVELLDGWISVESTPGQGSLFTCSLPKALVQDDSGDSSFGGGLVFFGDGEEN